MCKFYRYLAATVCLTTLLGLTGAAAKSPVPAAPKALNIPVVYYKMPNGLRVVISEDHSSPVAAVAVYYGVGSRVEPKGRTGFAHLFEHMMFQGSANIKKFEHIRYVEANGGNANGHTDFDYTNYYQTIPSDRVETALWLEADRMRSLDVSAENLKNQQNVVSEEIRVNVLNQPYQFFELTQLWINAFQNWANAHDGYGDLADVNAANIDDVRAFFKTYYAPNNAVLAVVGDVTAAEVRAMVEKHFASIPKQPDPPKLDASEPPQTQEKRLTQPDQLATLPALVTAYHMPAQNSPDFAPMALLSLILQGDDSSRFYQRLVKEKAVSLDLNGALNYFGNEFDYNGPMIMTTRSTYKPDGSMDQVVREMDGVLAEVQKNGVTAGELADAKVRYRSNYYNQVESAFGRAHMLCVLALFRDDPNQINTALDSFERVTADQVKAVAAKYLIPTNRTVIARVPAPKGTN